MNKIEMDRFVAENPHCAKAVFSNRAVHIKGMLMWDQLHISPDSPRLTYQRRNAEIKTTEHWGQRKLLVSEIYFFSQYLSPLHPAVCIYAGSSPGTHVPVLAEMFPLVHWVLVDPKFAQKTKMHLIPDPTKMEILAELFSDELASELKNRFKDQKVLFISDIRSWEKTQSRSLLEEVVQRDMASQKRWVETLQPAAALLKFRLPYTPAENPNDKFEEEMEYLDGKLLFPVWSPATSTECRLVVVPNWEGNYPVKKWNARVHEEIMYAFQTQTRTSWYDFDPVHTQVEGIDHCFDCAAEILVLSAYLDIYHQAYTTENVNLWIAYITQKLGVKGRKLGRVYTSKSIAPPPIHFF